MEWLSEIFRMVNDLGEGTFRSAVVMILVFALREFSKMRRSVEVLNVSMAQVLKAHEGHEHRITMLEERDR